MQFLKKNALMRKFLTFKQVNTNEKHNNSNYKAIMIVCYFILPLIIDKIINYVRYVITGVYSNYILPQDHLLHQNKRKIVPTLSILAVFGIHKLINFSSLWHICLAIIHHVPISENFQKCSFRSLLLVSFESFLS